MNFLNYFSNLDFKYIDKLLKYGQTETMSPKLLNIHVKNHNFVPLETLFFKYTT